MSFDAATDFYNVVARRKLSAGDDWQWCNLRMVGPDVMVEGGVPRALKSGKRKGSLTWRDGSLQACVVTQDELRAAHQAYEDETSKCHACLGDGKTVWSVSRADGVKHRTCTKCGGSGKVGGQ